MFCDLFIIFYLWKMMQNLASKVLSQKNSDEKFFLVAILKVTDKNNRIRIRTKMSRIRNTDTNIYVRWHRFLGTNRSIAIE